MDYWILRVLIIRIIKLMIQSAVFLVILTFMVAAALFMISRADLHEKEKRDTILLIASLFMTVLALNEFQNLHLSSPQTFHSYKSLIDYFPQSDRLKTDVNFDEQFSQVAKLLNATSSQAYPQIILVQTEKNLEQAFGSLKASLEQQGLPAAHIQLSEQSSLYWDKTLGQSIFQGLIEYSRKHNKQFNKIPTIFMEYKIQEDQSLLPQMISNVYSQGEINIVIYGNKASINQLQTSTDIIYWYSQTKEI